MRIRTIKPEWLDDEKLAAASDEARVLSVALILMSDDYGRGRASIATIAAETWRYALERNGGEHAPEIFARASRALRELVEIGFVGLYEVKGQRYFEIHHWKKHQKVDKPSAPRVPAPDQQETRENSDHRDTVATPSRDHVETLAPDLDPDPIPRPGVGPALARPTTPPQARVRRRDVHDFHGAPADAAQAALSAACVAAGGTPKPRGGGLTQQAWAQAACDAAELAESTGKAVDDVLALSARGFVAARGIQGNPVWWAERFGDYFAAGSTSPEARPVLDKLEAEQARLVALAANADPDTQAELHAQIRDIAAKRRQLKGAA